MDAKMLERILKEKQQFEKLLAQGSVFECWYGEVTSFFDEEGKTLPECSK